MKLDALQKPLTTPLGTEWLSKLNDALLKTSVKKDGDLVDLENGFELFINELIGVRNRKAALWWIGNGGSAALCSHLSQDALNKLSIRSQTLSDHSLLTCMANDFGYENVYAKPLEKLMSSGDLLIAISSSGNSENILKSVKLATDKGARTIGLSAFNPTNKLWNLPTNLSFFLPCDLYGLAEVGHEALLHAGIETLWLRETAAR